ncbi:AAA family ATPase [Streptomyces decoyicus]|uniref:AAA family ATPase n=1 Tax=Streptomyces decoyicus TaxID=249567 RepID=UPI0033B5B9A7
MTDDFWHLLDAQSDEPAVEFEPFGVLRHYSIFNLFGLHDHEFSIDVGEPTILTGSNGTGKSTVLRTISAVGRGDWEILLRIPFDRMILRFEAAEFQAVRESAERLHFRLAPKNGKPQNWTYGAGRNQEEVGLGKFLKTLSLREREVMFFEDDESGESTSARRLAAYLAAKKADSPNWARNISSSFPVLLVSDQRLAPSRLRRPRKRGTGDVIDTVAAIEAAVLHINDEVRKYKSLYGNASQNLDRDFPRRVLAEMSAMSSGREFTSKANVLRQFEELQELRRSLSAAGLIDEAEVEESIEDLPLHVPDARALITTYLTDTRKKLSTFEPLRKRLEPFIDFLRRHYKGKAIRIDQEEGFLIGSAMTAETIAPVDLSSGEQQIFILAHKLLFESDPGTLILIDEPELSLHVLWQSTFIEDLTEMSTVAGTYFLLATHSPTLIAGRNDLRRSLDG